MDDRREQYCMLIIHMDRFEKSCAAFDGGFQGVGRETLPKYQKHIIEHHQTILTTKKHACYCPNCVFIVLGLPDSLARCGHK